MIQLFSLILEDCDEKFPSIQFKGRGKYRSSFSPPFQNRTKQNPRTVLSGVEHDDKDCGLEV